MNKSHLKLLLWVGLVGLAAATGWLVLLGAANLVKYFQEGADPAAALKIVPNIPADSSVKLEWLPDEADTGRTVEPVTREQIEGAYLRAWLQWNLSYLRGEPYGLKTYFAGPSLEAVTASITGAVSKGYKITQVDTAHSLRLHLYSADGSVVAFTDTGAAVSHVIKGPNGTPALAYETVSSYDVVMFLDDGNWRVRQWVRTGDENSVQPKAAGGAGLVSINGRDFSLDGQKFQMSGVNYYPQATPWDKFWTSYSPAIIDKDFTLLAILGSDLNARPVDQSGKLNQGLNTIRIFVQFEQFGGAKPLPKMLANLDDLLAKAYTHGLRVVVTLFDFRTDYSLLLWPAADRHLESLLTRYKDNPAILAWDIKNEPDLDYKVWGQETVDSWLAHTIRLARTYDPNHLITVGWSTPAVAGTLAGQVDFVSFHYYAPVSQLAGQYRKVREQAPAGPVAITEFGLPTWNSFLFPGGHSEPEQAEYFAGVQAFLAENGGAGSIAWTMYDFSYVPGKVAGMLPWQNGPQKQMGIFDSGGKPKPAAAMLVPGANLKNAEVSALARYLKPFWLTLLAVTIVVALAIYRFRRIWLPRVRGLPGKIKVPLKLSKLVKKLRRRK